MNGDQHRDQPLAVGQPDTSAPIALGGSVEPSLPKPAASAPFGPPQAAPAATQPAPSPATTAAVPPSNPTPPAQPTARPAEQPVPQQPKPGRPTGPTTPAHPLARPSYREKDPDAIEWTSTANVQVWTAQQSMAMTFGALVLTAGVFLITRQDIFSTVAVAIAAGLMIYIGRRHPSAVRYSVAAGGIMVGSKFYPYQTLRSFAIESPALPGSVGIINIAPLKRFMPMLNITYSQEIEHRLLDALAERLPVESHHTDAMDRLLGKLRIQ